jgi:hypothetical protein
VKDYSAAAQFYSASKCLVQKEIVMSIKNTLAAFAVAAPALTGFATAQAKIVDLNPPATETFVPSPYTQDGYTFTAPGVAGGFVNWVAYGAPAYSAAGTAGATLFENFGGYPLVITKSDGSSFDFGGLGVASLLNNGIGGGFEIDVKHSSGVIDTNFVTIQSGVFGLQEISAVNGKDVSSVTVLSSLPGGFFQFGALDASPAASAVPETSTWAMMLAGFAGLSFAGYRRNKSVALAA